MPKQTLPNVCVLSLALVAVLAMPGCGPATEFDMNSKYMDQARADQGLVVILPGIEGESSSNRDIREGLYKGGIPYGLVIYRWGAALPGLGMLVNQTDVSRNRHMGEHLARLLVTYQQKHPGKPVFLIGHSAGGGIAVFTLEALAHESGARPVEGVFLLSSSLSSDYDLSTALRMTRRGLVNVSNKDDQLLNSGTATFGNVDGGKGDSAGRTGFYRTYPNVYESRITNALAQKEVGVIGPAHFVATREKLIEKYAPAWIVAPSWPTAAFKARSQGR